MRENEKAMSFCLKNGITYCVARVGSHYQIEIDIDGIRMLFNEQYKINPVKKDKDVHKEIKKLYIQTFNDLQNDAEN